MFATESFAFYSSSHTNTHKSKLLEHPRMPYAIISVVERIQSCKHTHMRQTEIIRPTQVRHIRTDWETDWVSDTDAEQYSLGSN